MLSFVYLEMLKMNKFWKSKKFWTLIAAIVAALSAYFAVGCSAQYFHRTKGVHIDTVETQVCTHTKNHSNEKHW